MPANNTTYNVMIWFYEVSKTSGKDHFVHVQSQEKQDKNHSHNICLNHVFIMVSYKSTFRPFLPSSIEHNNTMYAGSSTQSVG